MRDRFALWGWGWAAAVVSAAVLLGAVTGGEAYADPPVASFTVTPARPLSGDVVTFTSTSTGTITSQTWDLDGDGRCNDGTDRAAERTYAAPDTYSVTLCVDGPDGGASQMRHVVIGNRPPVAAIAV